MRGPAAVGPAPTPRRRPDTTSRMCDADRGARCLELRLRSRIPAAVARPPVRFSAAAGPIGSDVMWTSPRRGHIELKTAPLKFEVVIRSDSLNFRIARHPGAIRTEHVYDMGINRELAYVNAMLSGGELRSNLPRVRPWYKRRSARGATKSAERAVPTLLNQLKVTNLLSA
jgi:hypothetical protein